MVQPFFTSKPLIRDQQNRSDHTKSYMKLKERRASLTLCMEMKNRAGVYLFNFYISSKAMLNKDASSFQPFSQD